MKIKYLLLVCLSWLFWGQINAIAQNTTEALTFTSNPTQDSILAVEYGFRDFGLGFGTYEKEAPMKRFLSVDPLTKSYPELTPYQFASNTPIMAIDLDGLEAVSHELAKASNMQKAIDAGTITYYVYAATSGYKKACIQHTYAGKTITTYLSTSDPSEDDLRAKSNHAEVPIVNIKIPGIGTITGTWLKKGVLGATNPIAAWYSRDLIKMGQIASQDGVAQQLTKTYFPDKAHLSESYQNTHLHILGQVLATIIFGENSATYAANAHENIARNKGIFSGNVNDDDTADTIKDLINNHYARSLGNKLKKNFGIDGNTTWSPELLGGINDAVYDYIKDTFTEDLSNYHGITDYKAYQETLKKCSENLNKILGKK